MCHLRHRLNFFFYFKEHLCSILEIFTFLHFNHSMIYYICDVMMSIRTWDSLLFWIYLLNHNSLNHQTWSIDRYNQGQDFPGIFWTIWKTGDTFQALFNLETCSNYSIPNYVKFLLFHFCERVNKRELKMVNINY